MKLEYKLWYKSATVGLVAIILISLALFLYVTKGPAEEPMMRSYEDHVWLRKENVTLTASGEAGTATGSASTDRELHGYIYAIYLDFTSGISATTDITLTQASPPLTILQLNNIYTDTWYYPAVQQTNSAGAGTSTYEKMLVQNTVDITVGETTSGTVGIVTIYWGQ